MNRIFPFLIAIVAGSLLILSSCKRNSPIGAVGDPMEGEFPVFDTFKVPESKYFLYGRFDGHYTVWEDSLRSDWDTATRICDGTEPQWINCDPYIENIYYNFASEGEAADSCILSDDGIYYYQRTRFLRPEIADRRIDIFFYDCINPLDTNDPNFPLTQLSVLGTGAFPFTSTDFGRNGVEVVYTDSERELWRTKVGSGQPIDTYFRVNSLEQIPATDTNDSLALFVAEGEFAGRLFHDDSDAEIIVTEAKFRMRVVEALDTP